MPDMDAHVLPADILIPEITDFADTQTRRIHEVCNCTEFEIFNAAEKCLYFLLGGDKWQKSIEFAVRKLRFVPGLVQNEDRKEPQL